MFLHTSFWLRGMALFRSSYQVNRPLMLKTLQKTLHFLETHCEPKLFMMTHAPHDQHSGSGQWPHFYVINDSCSSTKAFGPGVWFYFELYTR